MHWIEIETEDRTRHFINLERVAIAQLSDGQMSLWANGANVTVTDECSAVLAARLGMLAAANHYSDPFDDASERDPDPPYEESTGTE